MKDIVTRLALLVKARYPLVQLVSHEEARVERALRRMAGEQALAIYTWRTTEGVLGPDGKALASGSERAEDALERMQEITEPALFVFFDMHPYLWDVRVVRRIRDMSRTMGPRRQAIVLVGYKAEVPEELAKQVVILDVPLPGREEVARLLALLLKKQRIDVSTERFEQFVKGALGLTEAEIKRLYARILLGGRGFDEDDLAELLEEKRQVIRRSEYLEFWDRAGSVDDVGGMDNLKRWLEARRAGFGQLARAYGLPEPKGMFLLGVQGCGKSLMAKAVADLWKLPLLRLDVAAVFQTGGAEGQSLRDTIRVAESLAPVVLWIDEIEKGFQSREQSGGGEAFGYFLTWMQEKQKPVFVVSTANEVRGLPPELLRKGRFDEIFFVDLPDVHERLTIFEIHLRNRDRNPEDFDLTVVAEETDRYSGAEIEQVIVGAMFAAFAEDREVDSDDLVDATRAMIPLAVTMDDHLKDLREWARPRARLASADRRRIDFFEEWDEFE